MTELQQLRAEVAELRDKVDTLIIAVNGVALCGPAGYGSWPGHQPPAITPGAYQRLCNA